MSNNNFEPKLVFEINNSKDFFKKLEDEYSDFDKEHLNSRHAINCAINSWHLTDWTYKEFFKDDERFQDRTINRTRYSGLVLYQNHLKERCPELEYMRKISNGIKHCKIRTGNNSETTAISYGDFSPYDYSRHDYLVPRFKIELGNGESIDFEDILKKTFNFWRDFINSNIMNLEEQN